MGLDIDFMKSLDARKPGLVDTRAGGPPIHLAPFGETGRFAVQTAGKSLGVVVAGIAAVATIEATGPALIYLATGGGQTIPVAGIGFGASGTGTLTLGGVMTFEQGAAATGVLATRFVAAGTMASAPVLTRPELIQGVADFIDGTWGPPGPPAASKGGNASTAYQTLKFVTPNSDDWP